MIINLSKGGGNYINFLKKKVIAVAQKLENCSFNFLMEIDDSLIADSVSRIKIDKIKPGFSNDLKEVEFLLKIQNEEVKTSLIFPVPQINSDADNIEAELLEWARTSNYFTDEAIKGLKDTFVGGLASSAYPQRFNRATILTISKWLSLAFYADRIFDILSADKPEKIYQLRKRIEQVIKGEDKIRPQDPAIVKGFYDIYFSTPEFLKYTFFRKSFFECLRKNEEEAYQRIQNNIPNESTIDRIRIKSCGGFHCVIVGFSAEGINPKYIFKKYPLLETMVEQAGLYTGLVNDIFSAEQEFIEVNEIKNRNSNYKSFNLVHYIYNKMKLERPELNHKQRLSLAINNVSCKVNNIIKEYNQFKQNLMQEVLTKQASKKEIEEIKIMIDIMDSWLKHIGWELLAKKYSGKKCSKKEIEDLLIKMTNI